MSMGRLLRGRLRYAQRFREQNHSLDQWVQLICGGTDFFRKTYSTLGIPMSSIEVKKTCFRREYSMIKPQRTKYQWVDSKSVQLFHELREVREKFVVYIYFRYVSMSATMVEAILKLNTEERPVETGRK